MKRASTLVADAAVAGQVQVMTLGGASPYETLHTLVHDGLSPFFAAACVFFRVPNVWRGFFGGMPSQSPR